MRRRIELAVFAALILLLGWIGYSYFGRGQQITSVLFANEKMEPLAIPDPTLRLDLLERVRKLEYKGTHRNIFTASLPPKPKPKAEAKATPPPAPVDTGPPPLQIPFRFYGYKEDPRTGRRLAFFTNGEDVFIAAEGDTIQKRFKLLKIGNQSAELEETASGRRSTLPLELPPQS